MTLTGSDTTATEVTKVTISTESNITTTDANISEIVTTSDSSQTETTEPAQKVLKGDFNKNGSLDIGDLTSLQKKLTKLQQIEKADFEYELNGDNKLNIWDYIILIRLLKV